MKLLGHAGNISLKPAGKRKGKNPLLFFARTENASLFIKQVWEDVASRINHIRRAYGLH